MKCDTNFAPGLRGQQSGRDGAIVTVREFAPAFATDCDVIDG
jgi:hypothetical protein